MLVGYKLLDENGAEVQTWGGAYGTTPEIPNRVDLPTGEEVHCPAVGPLANGYELVEWYMEPPPEPMQPQPQPPTAEEINAQIIAEINDLEDKQHRAVREYILGDQTAKTRLEVIDSQIVALRKTLVLIK